MSERYVSWQVKSAWITAWNTSYMILSIDPACDLGHEISKANLKITYKIFDPIAKNSKGDDLFGWIDILLNHLPCVSLLSHVADCQKIIWSNG